MAQKLVILAIFTIICLTSTAQKELPFSNGEKLVYAVGYKAALINTDVAEVIIKTVANRQSDTEVYEVQVHAKVYPTYRWFFDLDDSYISVLDAQTLRPQKLTIEISEGKHRASSQYQYDWNSRSVNTTYRNHKSAESKHKTMTLTNNSFDGVAMFTNIRNREAEEFTAGKREYMNFVGEDTIRPLGYQFVGREIKKIKGLGTFKTLKFTCQLIITSGEAFKDGSEITIWISDDRNKIPLLIESPIRVGSVVARLIKYENLKYALESRVK